MSLPAYNNENNHREKILYLDKDHGTDLRIPIKWVSGGIPLLKVALYKFGRVSAWEHNPDGTAGKPKEWEYIYKGDF
jgi:hypothetical protein